jgi:hypothetical protein
MRIAKLSPERTEFVTAVLKKAFDEGHSIQFAYDELDQSIKFKVGGFAWSPPIPTEEI